MIPPTFYGDDFLQGHQEGARVEPWHRVIESRITYTVE
jgi:hypothetical protein